MSRLIVVSNRVNAPKSKGDAPVGGLAVAISAALREYTGFWFGWSGHTTESFTGEVETRTTEGAWDNSLLENAASGVVPTAASGVKSN